MSKARSAHGERPATGRLLNQPCPLESDHFSGSVGYVLACALAGRRAPAVWRRADHAVGAVLWSALIRRGVLTDFLMVRFFAARRMGTGLRRRKVVTDARPLAFVLRLNLNKKRGVADKTPVLAWFGHAGWRKPCRKDHPTCDHRGGQFSHCDSLSVSEATASNLAQAASSSDPRLLTEIAPYGIGGEDVAKP
jgi:hypothetical protein